MRKRTEREIQRESRWQEIVAGQRQSGQSVRAYCRQAGVEESAFYWWRRALARRSRQRCGSSPAGRNAPEGRSGRSAVRRPAGVIDEIDFLPVQVAAGPGTAVGRCIEIVLGGDRVLRIVPGFDRQTLLEVLGALEGRGC